MSSTHTKQDRISKAARARAGKTVTGIRAAAKPVVTALTVVPAPPKQSKARTAKTPKIRAPKAPTAPRALKDEVLFTPPAALYFDDDTGRNKTANILEDFIEAHADDEQANLKLRQREAFDRALSSDGAPSKGWLKHLISSLRGNTQKIHNPGPKVANWLGCRIQKRMIPLTTEERAQLAAEQAKKKTTKR